MVPYTRLAFVVWLTCLTGGRSAAGAPILPAPFKVVIVIEENRYFEDVIGNVTDAPYINQLASGGALFTQSFGVARPSQPNYFALFGGDTYGITSNAKPAQKFTEPNLGAALRNAGKSFVGYADGLPDKDFDGEVSGAYVRKHNPWVNWTNDFSTSPHALPSTVNQPFTSFPSDFTALPDLSIVVPDDNHNMHDGTTRSGDAWLRDNLSAYAAWAQTHNSLLIVTFDESGFSRGEGRIPTLFLGPMVRQGAFAETIDHYDVLRTLLEIYNLAPIAKAANATPIVDVWRSPWQNVAIAADVDGNGAVLPNDVLAVIDQINGGHAGQLARRQFAERLLPPYYDVSGDGLLTPLDALAVIDFINKRRLRLADDETFAAAPWSGAARETSVPEPDAWLLWALGAAVVWIARGGRRPRGSDRAAMALGVAALFAAQRVSAATIVVANRANDPVAFRITGDDGAANFTLAVGELRPLWTKSPLRIGFRAGQTTYRYQLEPNAAYYFAAAEAGGVQLHRIGLTKDDQPPAAVEAGLPAIATAKAALPPDGAAALDRAAPRASPRSDGPPEQDRARAGAGAPFAPLRPLVIPIKILVDDDEPASRERWEQRLRGRVDRANDILEHHCFARFEIVAVERWESSNSLRDFGLSLREFEERVRPEPARLAVGFTSQYAVARGRTNLGGVRGALGTHLLLREWSQLVSEPERLELLLHELGHFLGAVHSPEADSVMRPLLGDRKSRRKGFLIGFDPINTLAMGQLSEELRVRPVFLYRQLSLETQLELRKLYEILAKALPDDPAALQYLSRVDEGKLAPLARATRLVVRAVATAAEENALGPGLDGRRLTGDDLAEYYVQRAAEVAQQLPAPMHRQAFCVGLALAADRTGQLNRLAWTKPFQEVVESNDEATRRLALLGNPTARRREDLLQHFLVSAALTATLGAPVAEGMGLAKERADAEPGGSGFSFVDLQADLAGIRFAQQIEAGKISLGEVAETFRVAQALPAADGLEEGLAWTQFERRYGSFNDERFLALRGRIEAAIRAANQAPAAR